MCFSALHSQQKRDFVLDQVFNKTRLLECCKLFIVEHQTLLYGNVFYKTFNLYSKLFCHLAGEF